LLEFSSPTILCKCCYR